MAKRSSAEEIAVRLCLVTRYDDASYEIGMSLKKVTEEFNQFPQHMNANFLSLFDKRNSMFCAVSNTSH